MHGRGKLSVSFVDYVMNGIEDEEVCNENRGEGEDEGDGHVGRVGYSQLEGARW